MYKINNILVQLMFILFQVLTSFMVLVLVNNNNPAAYQANELDQPSTTYNNKNTKSKYSQVSFSTVLNRTRVVSNAQGH